jgi:hypothetical protein
VALNQTYWARVFQREFVKEAQTLVDVLEQRILPTFANIEQESELVSSETWNNFMSAPGTGDEDHSELADAATQMGVEHYMLLSGMRQGIVNMVTAALYHMFEQQMMLFLRRELLDLHEENNSKLFSTQEVEARLRKHGIDITKLGTWSIIDELREVANSIKHAEGRATKRLQTLRPDLFKEPGLPEFGQWHLHANRRVFQPLSGQDIYVSLEDVRSYRDAVCTFWQQLSDAMQASIESSWTPPA